MYNQRQHQGQNVFMNGGHGHQQYGMPMNAPKGFQSQQHQSHSQLRQQQDHSGHGHAGNFGTHQHNASATAFTASTPQFNPTQLRNGTPNHLQNGLNRPPNEHWGQQLTLYRECQDMTGTHPHARVQANNKTSTGNAEQSKRDGEQEDKSRPRPGAPVETDKHSWTEMDLGGQGLRALSTGIFSFKFLKKLYLSNNNLRSVRPEIGKLRGLSHLDLSKNQLTYVPPELGMLVNLKTLLLFDNELDTLPYELGSLYQLEMLGIEGNPNLNPELKEMVIESGTKSLVSWLQDSAPVPEPPPDRDWITFDDARQSGGAQPEALKVLSYNTLCDKMATHAMYGYTSRSALAWEHRKELILDEIRGRDADIVCLQEIDTDSFQELFRPTLAHNDYKGVFWPKSRARWTDKEARLVDGCATFFKNSKYILLDKQHIDYAHTAINRPDMKTEHDVFNRVMPRDNIAIVCLLENRQTGARLIVANTHCHWDAAYRDVKVVQVAILLEQLSKMAEAYTKIPPCKDKKLYRFSESDTLDENGDPVEPTAPAEPLPEPQPSQEYTSGTQIPLLICIDTNSLPDSGVYELLANGSLSPSHPDLGTYSYGNFTRQGMSHPFALKSAYAPKDLPFTNYTPGFEGMIDYIWYTGTHMSVKGLLGKVDEEYLKRCPGFPSWHYPSDHLALLAEFAVKERRGVGGKEAVKREVDFGGGAGAQRGR